MALLPMKDLSLGWLSSQAHGLDKVNEESGWLGPSGYTEKQVIRFVNIFPWWAFAFFLQHDNYVFHNMAILTTCEIFDNV